MIPALADTLASALISGRADDTWTLIELGFNFCVPLILVLLGWLIGGRRERAHLRDLARREALNSHFLRTDLRAYGPADTRAGAAIVTSEVVIGADYCKVFLAFLRNLLGGNLRTYETLANRARREALLRLVEQARDQQFNALCCIRVESSNIGKGIMPMVAVLACATAYRTHQAE